LGIETTGTKRPTFTLSGHSFVGDKRTTPIRGDLADIKLAGKLFAPHYAVPMIRSCVAPSTPMYEAPDPSSTGVSELIFGEDFAVLDVAGIWAWGYSVADDYLGYIALSALDEPVTPTHIVISRGAVISEQPQVRAAKTKRLPMGARLLCGATSDCGQYLATSDGFVHVDQIATISAVEGDPAELAERLLGAPYLWGGRCGDAIDCSGLVQLTFGMKGIQAPRDADMQQAAFGKELSADESLQRNDLVFFPGHVGIMIDSENIIHANMTAVAVSVEPLSDVAARYADQPGGPILARKRVTLT
jgi:cell wall-associated NlpC family hydrolase